jgi:Dipeptidyl peptidase IV (DPP IV) N-terminal region
MLQHSSLLAVFTILLAPALCRAQGTMANHQRANDPRKDIEPLAITIPGSANLIGETGRFWYRRIVKGGHEFVVVTASTLVKQPAFDHARLAASLSKSASENYRPQTLPFQTFTFSNDRRHIQFTAAGSRWRTDVTSYACEKLGPEAGFPRRAGLPRVRRQDEAPRISPDGKREAFILNYNIHIRDKGTKEPVALSYDGSEGNHCQFQPISWSPDSKKLAAYRIHSGYHRKIQYIESSPADRLQPKTFQIEYEKPGDELDLQQPVLFDVERKKQHQIGNSLFPNP